MLLLLSLINFFLLIQHLSHQIIIFILKFSQLIILLIAYLHLIFKLVLQILKSLFLLYLARIIQLSFQRCNFLLKSFDLVLLSTFFYFHFLNFTVCFVNFFFQLFNLFHIIIWDLERMLNFRTFILNFLIEIFAFL